MHLSTPTARREFIAIGHALDRDRADVLRLQVAERHAGDHNRPGTARKHRIAVLEKRIAANLKRRYD